MIGKMRSFGTVAIIVAAGGIGCLAIAYLATVIFGGIGGDQAAKLSQPIDQKLVERGAYVAFEGDCSACHTAPGGKPFAGGLSLATPIGVIYSTNITPDAKSGIGNYTYGDFERAVRRGITRQGRSLYPAMPYPSYARISERDMQALYAFFMRGVKPARRADRPSDILWPLSMRWPLTYWRWLYAPPVQPAVAVAGSDPIAERGAYLVEGLGHCGTCHTPRGIGLEEKGLTPKSASYLAGGDVDHYLASDLRGNSWSGLGTWSEADIVRFLKTGFTQNSAVFGGMVDVVVHSTQNMTDSDLKAIAHFLKTLPHSGPERKFTYEPVVAMALYHGDVSKTGALDYLNNCSACHRSSGKGYPNTFPSLAGNPVVNAADPSSLIHIVLTGGSIPSTRTAPTHFAMPAFSARLTDQQVANVVTFIRSSWGNHAPGVEAAQVAKMRAALATRKLARAP